MVSAPGKYPSLRITLELGKLRAKRHHDGCRRFMRYNFKLYRVSTPIPAGPDFLWSFVLQTFYTRRGD